MNRSKCTNSRSSELHLLDHFIRIVATWSLISWLKAFNLPLMAPALVVTCVILCHFLIDLSLKAIWFSYASKKIFNHSSSPSKCLDTSKCFDGLSKPQNRAFIFTARGFAVKTPTNQPSAHTRTGPVYRSAGAWKPKAMGLPHEIVDVSRDGPI